MEECEEVNCERPGYSAWGMLEKVYIAVLDTLDVMVDEVLDVLVVGGGPTGLHAGLDPMKRNAA